MDSTDTQVKDHRKYQVFISSTFLDLTEQRRMVLDVVVDRGHMPIALERFPPADKTVRSVIQKTIEASQIVLVIVGFRYGALVEGKDISYCQLEYEMAYDSDKRVVVPFVLAAGDVRQERLKLRAELDSATLKLRTLVPDCLEYSNLRKNIAALESELANEAKLEAFRDLVTTNRFYKPFSLERGGSANVFNERMVLEALIEALDMAREKQIPAWIREPPELELADTLAAVSRNVFLGDVVNAMAKFDRLEPRVRDHAEEKAAGAAFFVDTYLQAILQTDVGLFFESGSTVAYVAHTVGRRLGPDTSAPPIATNNVLAFLLFWLVQRLQCTLFPWGPPEQQYGAIFGPINRYVPESRTPCFPPRPLRRGDREAIELLEANSYSPANWPGQKLLLGALSGLQLTSDPDIADCLGPHVGSPRNKVFKRFMYATGLPVMLFMTADKIDCKVDTEKCHFILDQIDGQDLTWRRFCRDVPVAFCVGCQNQPELLSRTTDRFRALGMEIIQDDYKTTQTAFVARNQAFIDNFEAKLRLF